jgi:hypothetical protein
MVLAITNDTLEVTPELMNMGIGLGVHVIAARAKYNPGDSAGYTQAFENVILKVVEKYGPQTERELVKRVSPKNRAGGYGYYLMALKNLKADCARELVECKKTRVGSIMWGLPRQRVR